MRGSVKQQETHSESKWPTVELVVHTTMKPEWTAEIPYAVRWLVSEGVCLQLLHYSPVYSASAMTQPPNHLVSLDSPWCNISFRLIKHAHCHVRGKG